MQKKSVLFIAVILFFCTSNLRAQQVFTKQLDSKFKGRLTDCFSLRNSYYFIGNQDSISGIYLLLYKTDNNGNILLKNTNHLLLSKGYIIINDDENIVLADSNRIIKYDENFNLLWVKNFQSNQHIKKLKHTRDNKYLVHINNSIYIADTSGNIIQTPISYSDELSDFDLYNDTLYTLTLKYINVGIIDETFVSKYLISGEKIFERKLSLFKYSYPKYLIINQNKIHQIISSEGKNNGFSIQSTSLNDSFNVINNAIKSIYNFEIPIYKYINNSLLVYWYSIKSYSNRLIQLNSSLENLSDNYPNDIIFTDFHLTKDGDIIGVDWFGFIYKYKGSISTYINSSILNTETHFFPNPFSEQTTFKLNNTESSQLFIYDLKGQLILSKSFSSGEELTLQSNDLPNIGMYLYKINANDRIYTGKIMFH